MNTARRDLMRVSVVLGCPDRAAYVELELAPGATVADAVAAAQPRIEAALPGRAWCAVGVHGRIAAPGDALADGDRVELYRPLTMDPKDARRQRARKRKGP